MTSMKAQQMSSYALNGKFHIIKQHLTNTEQQGQTGCLLSEFSSFGRNKLSKFLLNSKNATLFKIVTTNWFWFKFKSQLMEAQKNINEQKIQHITVHLQDTIVRSQQKKWPSSTNYQHFLQEFTCGSGHVTQEKGKCSITCFFLLPTFSEHQMYNVVPCYVLFWLAIGLNLVIYLLTWGKCCTQNI